MARIERIMYELEGYRCLDVCDLFFDTLWTMVKHLFGQLTVVCR